MGRGLPLQCKSVETSFPIKFLKATSWIRRPDLHFGFRACSRPQAALRCLVVGALMLGLQAAGRVAASEPLQRKIDRAIDAKIKGDAAAQSTDAEFLRRVCLDLTGMIPTPADARAFLDDPSPYKPLADRPPDGGP